ncbi:hypothetical protein K788_0002562 [Paraburkholderia caribensis MBA4]|uniref:Uncharacterized protein n=1 Tax=Paraburkholderia caribensis MBA4 TaxID=1323664 RepID=A0A0N7JU04_9BURK|nr:hypothetical protein K788_0002562 [Paraburkholderia caribensis MBA4]
MRRRDSILKIEPPQRAAKPLRPIKKAEAGFPAPALYVIYASNCLAI